MIFHNTKLINLGETEVSLFLFVLLVVFFLAERCRQPLATLRERLHLSARATLLLHFVLELAPRRNNSQSIDNLHDTNCDLKAKLLHPKS